MKIATISHNNQNHVGLVHDGKVFLIHTIDNSIPNSLREMLEDWDTNKLKCQNIQDSIAQGNHNENSLGFEEVSFQAPIPNPTSCRDGYAFRQHVAAARRNRGVEMIPEFDQYPIFYFTNHNAIQGPGDIVCMPDHFQKLDFELEAAVIIGKKGRNFTAEQADSYIAGYCIMNDMSARLLQMEEMKLNLGPAKGKDFSTVIGPWMVTPDELDAYKIPAKEGHSGNNFDLAMKCWVNGVQVSEGNMGDMDWTFAEIIERCAYGADVFPGDVIGSGTVGTGCLLELNGTGLFHDKNYKVQWLQPGDVVDMEIDGLGRISNTMILDKSDLSILSLKKNV